MLVSMGGVTEQVGKNGGRHKVGRQVLEPKAPNQQVAAGWVGNSTILGIKGSGAGTGRWHRQRAQGHRVGRRMLNVVEEWADPRGRCKLNILEGRHYIGRVGNGEGLAWLQGHNAQPPQGKVVVVRGGEEEAGCGGSPSQGEGKVGKRQVKVTWEGGRHNKHKNIR